MRHLIRLSSACTDLGTQPRKPQQCNRCHRKKYGNGIGGEGNHKKKYCDDGARTRDDSDSPPAWPQPAGVFSEGTYFHPLVFIETLRRFHGTGAENDCNIDQMERRAFIDMVESRKVEIEDPLRPGHLKCLFKLYPYLTVKPALSGVVETHNGMRYLRVDCLSGPSHSSNCD